MDPYRDHSRTVASVRRSRCYLRILNTFGVAEEAQRCFDLGQAPIGPARPAGHGSNGSLVRAASIRVWFPAPTSLQILKLAPTFGD